MTAQQKTNKQVLIKLALGVLLTFSTIGFIFSDFQSFSLTDKNILRTVGGVDITITDLNRERDNITQTLGTILNNPMITRQITDQALENLTLRSAITHYTQTHGILASQDEIAKMIYAIPAFHDMNGQFDAIILKKILQSQKISTKQFKQSVTQNIIVENFIAPITTDFPLSNKMASTFNSFAFEKVNFTAYEIDYNKLPNNLKKITALSDKDLKNIYDQNKDTLYRPALKDIEYAVFDAENLHDKIVISKTQIADFYHSNKDRLYTQAEKRHVLQIVLDNQEKSAEIYKKLKATNDFINIAKQYGYKKIDIDLGEVTVDDITGEEAQKQVFSAPTGTLLEPIQTDFGYVIYFVKEIQQPIVKPLKIVEPEIKNTLFQKALSDYLGDIQSKIDDDLAGGASLEEITEKYGSKIKKQQNLTSDGFIYNSEILNNPQLKMARLNAQIPLEDINDYNVGDDIPLIYGDNGAFIILKITASTPQLPLEFEQAKESLKNKELQKQKHIVLKNIIKELKNSANKDVLCAKYQIKKQDYTITRNDSLPPEINLSNFSMIVFAKNNKFLVSKINKDLNTAMILGVNKIMPADKIPTDKSEDFTLKLQKNYNSYIQTHALNMLKNAVTIETNDNLLKDYVNQGIEN